MNDGFCQSITYPRPHPARTLRWAVGVLWWAAGVGVLWWAAGVGAFRSFQAELPNGDAVPHPCKARLMLSHGLNKYCLKCTLYKLNCKQNG